MAEKTGFNRRDFLKIIGASAGVAAAGCGKELPEKFIPYVIQPDEVIPGVSTWYAGSCNECSAGCGTLIRTREGRALKIEGNPNHPVNHGGLCTHGQSAVQSLYDPDRIREPMKRDIGGSFTPISWADAMNMLGEAVAGLATSGSSGVLLTKRTSGTEVTLIQELSKKVPALKHLQYDFGNREVIDEATAQVFGKGYATQYDFSKAEVVVSFGADYLESWLSPVSFANGWAERRRPNEKGEMSRVVHFEPRLSLTAGNADEWVMNTPGSDVSLLLALLKLVYDKTAGRNLNSSGKEQVAAVVASVDLKKALAGTGVEEAKLEKLAAELVKAQTSLVVAGGASVSGAQGLPAAVLAHLLNAALGNVGKSLVLVKSAGSHEGVGHRALVTLLDEVVQKKQKVGLLVVNGTNPAYSLPAKAKFREALSKIGMVVCVSSHLDETTNLANLVLPLSHQLESWGDAEPLPGVFNLNQPAMQPLYKTQSFGDTLISLAANAKLNKPFEGIGSYYDYLRSQWKERTGEAGFEDRWIGYVEKGGDWSKASASVGGVEVSSNIPALKELKAKEAPAPEGTFQILAYPSINSFDGKAANRPWMQELPNPITTAVWGSWVELHPEVAGKVGVATGDVVQLVSDSGYIEAPAYVTKYIHPGLLAVPIGQGHDSYGRFANGVGTNPLSFLSVDTTVSAAQLLGAGVRVRKATAKEELVIFQGSDTQLKRGIARSVPLAEFVKNGKKDAHKGHEAAESEHGKEHEEEDELALGPRKLPKQMYAQMQHPLYRWGMSVDLAACTGCSACIVACYAENNVPVVGKTICNEGREMSWLRMERFLDGPDSQPVDAFLPMMCQHCANAPCEPVCPVYATYHTEEGLNSMVYNRCVGTRYCLNNCSYKVRRFNWFKYRWAEPMNWQLNPDVTVREVGVMEKCTFCIQRIREVQGNAKDEGRQVRDGEIQPACASSCPTKAITFGNLLDEESQVAKNHESARSYKVLDVELNTQPAVAYLARVKNSAEV